MDIKFGTDGWRGVIARDFTFDNLAIVAQATMDWLHRDGLAEGGLVIGYDRRFLSKEFAERTAEIAAGNGIRVLLSHAPAPTPAVSWNVFELRRGAGIMITASHNPPTYNGFKIKESFGGSARPDTTKKIEQIVADNLSWGRGVRSVSLAEAVASGAVERMDLFEGYYRQLGRYVDLDALRSAYMRVGCDPMYGAGAGCIPALLPGVEEIHADHNPGFGGTPPEPTEEHLRELSELVRTHRLAAGLALDGDADRIGAVDETGEFFSSHRIFTVLLRHLVERKGNRGGVVKTVSTTRMIDLLCQKYRLPLHETPIGFKHICEKMLAHDIMMGGEESGGLGVTGHIPERDGVLMGLLLLESIVASGKGLRKQLEETMEEIGHFHYRRIDLQIAQEPKERLIRALSEGPPQAIAGEEVASTNFSDGFKFIFRDGSWLLVRPSGTEPVLRLYSEAGTPERVEAFLAAGRDLAGI